jgi:hypothetical protein
MCITGGKASALGSHDVLKLLEMLANALFPALRHSEGLWKKSSPAQCVNPDNSDLNTQANVDQKRKITLIFFTFCI